MEYLKERDDMGEDDTEMDFTEIGCNDDDGTHVTKDLKPATGSCKHS
jgi:hypothetical protein